ncbi:MAG: 16S rRNA (guanine(527)-N(7))-methyltransferase RsmG [Phycisphaerales bacterium]|nr:16S rRNA (guanine(527)-N(7))-methyltransferase RsmG [Phycisphaerales bacterium]
MHDAHAIAPTPEFLAAAGAVGVEFEPGDVERLGRYLGLLLETNRSFNLTAITEPAQAWMRLIFDALTLLPLLADLPKRGRVLDVGSGGGLPGVPLAILMPNLEFTLLEATGKKAEFLGTVAARLGLTNLAVVNERAERAAHDRGSKGERTEPGVAGTVGLRGSFDAVTARALGPLATAAELTVPFAKVGGLILLVKGQRAEEELAEAQEALHLLHASHAATVETPTGRIVVLEKFHHTPKAYPRRDGEPKRTPLGVRRP